MNSDGENLEVQIPGDKKSNKQAICSPLEAQLTGIKFTTVSWKCLRGNYVKETLTTQVDLGKQRDADAAEV